MYDINNPQSGPQILGDFITTAMLMISTDSAVISNATLSSAKLRNHNNTLTYMSSSRNN